MVFIFGNKKNVLNKYYFHQSSQSRKYKINVFMFTYHFLFIWFMFEISNISTEEGKERFFKVSIQVKLKNNFSEEILFYEPFQGK